MKRANCIVAVTLLTAAFSAIAAPESCERIKSDIAQRIINNGVPEANFTLTIVPNDQADQPDSQVVGHCANDTQNSLCAYQQRQCACKCHTIPGRPNQRATISR